MSVGLVTAKTERASLRVAEMGGRVSSVDVSHFLEWLVLRACCGRGSCLSAVLSETE